MFDTPSLTEAVDQLQIACEALDPECLHGEDAVRVVALATRGERLLAAIRLAAARRAKATGVWQQGGYRSPQAWLAAKTGSSLGHAARSLETAEALASLPETADALKAGKVSEAQAQLIGEAAAADPTAESVLLRDAGREGFSTLRRQCQRVKAAADQREVERYEELRASRYFRHWNAPDGALHGEFRLPPDEGAVLLSGVEAHLQERFAEARRDGRREPAEAYAADALVDLARHQAVGDCGGAPRAVVHLRVDHDAYLRGSTEPGEVCEVEGAGPVPVATARNFAHDAIVYALAVKGTDVTRLANLGRSVPQAIRQALLERDPVCCVPGCEVRHGLEIDHRIVPFAQGGSVSLENCNRLCHWHHYLRTHHGYRLTGRPGAWHWHPPGDGPPASTPAPLGEPVPPPGRLGEGSPGQLALLAQAGTDQP